jgi:hypothetical protein
VLAKIIKRKKTIKDPTKRRNEPLPAERTIFGDNTRFSDPPSVEPLPKPDEHEI